MAPEAGVAERGSGRARRQRGSVRLTIIDDNPFLREPDGQFRPRAATFHRFAEAVVRAGPFGVAKYVIPVSADARDGTEQASALGTVDESLLHIVPSAPFEGAAGYLRRLPWMWRHNLPLLRGALHGEHLVWIKVPGSNGAAAALVADALGVSRFAYVVGSVSEVVAASPRTGLARTAALGAAALHDGTTTMLTHTGPSLRLGPELFTSAIDEVELLQAAGERDRRTMDEPWRIAWAGRMAPEKGLATLLRAVTLLVATGRDVRLSLIGDGPERPRLEAQARTLGITDSISWEGYVGERERFLALLRESDLFVLPSLTEGVPKVLLEAMACGLPVVASAVGGIPALLDDGDRGRLLRAGDEIDLAAAIRSVLEDPSVARTFRERGVAWAADHTAQRQAERMVDWMRATFPALPWPV